MTSLKKIIKTNSWQLEIENNFSLGSTVCIPTVHAAGDQRVLRCAKSLLDMGYDIHFIWLGGNNKEESSPHPRIRETRLPEGKSFRQRITLLFPIIKLAWKANADLWHIHDFYMLPFAWLWKLRTKKLVIYDVHEYYPICYSQHHIFPKWLQPKLERFLTRIENYLALKLDAANTVSDTLASRFQAIGLKAIATPNYPSSNIFLKASRQLTPPLLQHIVHIGTLIPERGPEVIIQLAKELAQSSPDIKLTVISKFNSVNYKTKFYAAIEEAKLTSNLQMIDPLPAHKIPELLANCGIGLQIVQNVGELPFSVNSKLYEYTILGLAIVASDLPATRNFIETHAVGKMVTPDSAKDFANAIIELNNNADKVCEEVNKKAALALEELSWEKVCAPRLQALVKQIDKQKPNT